MSAGQIFHALAQRRDPDADDVQPKEEILAEPPGAHVGLEITVGRGDDARIDGDGLAPAHPFETVLFEKTQQLDLQLRR